MFKIIEHVNYGGDNDHGHAKVFMNTGSHGCIIDCIYDIDDEWHFMYENNHCLTYEEIIEFENWFIENMENKKWVVYAIDEEEIIDDIKYNSREEAERALQKYIDNAEPDEDWSDVEVRARRF